MNRRSQTLLVLSVLTAACGSREVPLENMPEDTGGGFSLPEIQMPSLGKEPSPEEDDGAGGGDGPKVMGYDHWVRASYGLLQGNYEDEQENKTTNRRRKQEDVKLTGVRYTLEHYPWSRSIPGSHYGYTYAEMRDEIPDPDYWLRRQTMMAVFGYVMKKNRLIAPVVGIHWEFNKIDVTQHASPEVAKSDVKATIVGVHYRQKIWGTGSWFAVYHKGKLHLLNIGSPSNGFEAEVGAGTTFKFAGFQAGFEIGGLYQRFRGDAIASEADKRKARITSISDNYFAMLTLWL